MWYTLLFNIGIAVLALLGGFKAQSDGCGMYMSTTAWGWVLAACCVLLIVSTFTLSGALACALKKSAGTCANQGQGASACSGARCSAFRHPCVVMSVLVWSVLVPFMFAWVTVAASRTESFVFYVSCDSGEQKSACDTASRLLRCATFLTYIFIIGLIPVLFWTIRDLKSRMAKLKESMPQLPEASSSPRQPPASQISDDDTTDQGCGKIFWSIVACGGKKAQRRPTPLFLIVTILFNVPIAIQALHSVYRADDKGCTEFMSFAVRSWGWCLAVCCTFFVLFATCLYVTLPKLHAQEPEVPQLEASKGSTEPEQPRENPSAMRRIWSNLVTGRFPFTAVMCGLYVVFYTFAFLWVTGGLSKDGGFVFPSMPQTPHQTCDVYTMGDCKTERNALRTVCLAMLVYLVLSFALLGLTLMWETKRLRKVSAARELSTEAVMPEALQATSPKSKIVDTTTPRFEPQAAFLINKPEQPDSHVVDVGAADQSAADQSAVEMQSLAPGSAPVSYVSVPSALNQPSGSSGNSGHTVTSDKDASTYDKEPEFKTPELDESSIALPSIPQPAAEIPAPPESNPAPPESNSELGTIMSESGFSLSMPPVPNGALKEGGHQLPHAVAEESDFQLGMPPPSNPTEAATVSNNNPLFGGSESGSKPGLN